MARKRNKLTDFMADNKSMCLIKECRELARMNSKNNQDGAYKRSDKRIMRSFDTLDEMESDITSSNDSLVRDPGALDETEKTPESSEHDLDNSFDEYGDRIFKVKEKVKVKY